MKIDRRQRAVFATTHQQALRAAKSRLDPPGPTDREVVAHYGIIGLQTQRPLHLAMNPRPSIIDALQKEVAERIDPKLLRILLDAPDIVIPTTKSCPVVHAALAHVGRPSDSSATGSQVQDQIHAATPRQQIDSIIDLFHATFLLTREHRHRWLPHAIVRNIAVPIHRRDRTHLLFFAGGGCLVTARFSGSGRALEAIAATIDSAD